MKIPKITNAVGHIDDELIADAAESCKGTKRSPLFRAGIIAACLAVLIIACAVMLPFMRRTVKVTSKYKNVNITTSEYAIVWPWEFLAEDEKYTTIEIDGVKYSKCREVSDYLVGDMIDTYTATGYDGITNKKHTSDFEVYGLKNIPQSQFTAVKIEGAYYVFKNSEYNPPKVLGELFDNFNLNIERFTELTIFSEHGGNTDGAQFLLSDDSYIWGILSGCKDAEFIENKKPVFDKEYLSFTVNSEALGIYNRAMYITSDGYLWTNMFDWSYAFDIGEDTAQKIIKYSKENSLITTYNPLEKPAVTGKIVEITDKYLLLDDSVLCKNEADGETYKILLNNIRISRYVDYGVIHAGDLVRISYEGYICKENENKINSAYSVSKVVISNGEVLIPE